MDSILGKAMSRFMAVSFLALCLIHSGYATDTAGREAKDEVKRIDNAIRVLNEMSREVDKGIPASLLEDCHGLAIIPDVIKAAFVIGGRLGKGLLIARNEAGGWSSPCFIRITGGSAGWQIGVQSADLILVFRTRRSVENFSKGKFTLGADVGVAVGPQGRSLEANTDVELKAEILSYSKSRGLYVGLSLQGASLHVHAKANRNFYGRETGCAEIFEGAAAKNQAAIDNLKLSLDNFIKNAKR